MPVPFDTNRLIKLLRLIGSDYVGKLTATAANAHRYIRARGRTWGEIVKPPAAWQEMVDYCYPHRFRLHEDHGFLIDANQWTREPSQRQLERLKNIYRKLRSGR